MSRSAYQPPNLWTRTSLRASLRLTTGFWLREILPPGEVISSKGVPEKNDGTGEWRKNREPDPSYLELHGRGASIGAQLNF